MYKKLLVFAGIVSSITGMEKSSAENYDKASQVQKSNGQLLVEKYLPNIHDVEKVIDWGCGAGRQIEILSRKHPGVQFVGIDVNRNIINRAREHCEHLPNANFYVGDACDYRPEQTYFEMAFIADIALCISTAHWIKDQEKLLCNIAASLKKGGKVLVSMAGDDGHHMHPLKNAWKMVAQKDRWLPCLNQQQEAPYYPTTTNKMQHMLNQAGLEATILKITDQKRQFENRAKLKEWACGWVWSIPILNSLPQESRDIFINELLEAYVDQIGSSKADGSITYSIPSLIFLAQKKDEKTE